MNPVLEELQGELGVVVQALRAAGIDAYLIGGLALALSAPPFPAELLDSAIEPDVDDPQVLAARIRPTGDIDLAIPWPRDLRSEIARVMSSIGFVQNTEDRFSYHSAAAKVDFVRSRPVELLDVIAADIDNKPISIAGVSSVHVVSRDGTRVDVQVAGAASLIVQKCVAWRDCHEPRHLADVGTLAFRALDNSTTRPEVDAIVNALSLFAADVRVALKQFETADSPGPGYFTAAARAASGLTERQWAPHDQPVREQVSGAVRRVLATWLR